MQESIQKLIKKCHFKEPGVILNAPFELESAFLKLGFIKKLNHKKPSTNTLIFVQSQKVFIDFLSLHLKSIQEDSILWFAYPKKSSGIKSDVNRDIIAELGLHFDLKSVSAISIDDTWSALRFRPIEFVGK